MESVGDARSFLSAAREVALSKPIIVIKAGRSEAASRAAASHTGALTGSDEVLDAAFRRSEFCACTTSQTFSIWRKFSAGSLVPKGPRLTILTNAGGPAVLATDSLVANGGELAELSPESLQRLNEFLPAHWSHNNPIDVLGDADSERYARALEIASQDPNSDGCSSSSLRRDDRPFADRRTSQALRQGIWQARARQLDGRKQRCRRRSGFEFKAGIPTFPFPDTAARAFTYMWRYTYNLRGLYETPALAENSELERARPAIRSSRSFNARNGGRVLLTEPSRSSCCRSTASPQ
jgi:acetyltransferase